MAGAQVINLLTPEVLDTATYYARVQIRSATYNEQSQVGRCGVGADLILTHRADPNLTQGGTLRF